MSVHRRGKKWVAVAYVKGKHCHLGTFPTKSEAKAEEVRVLSSGRPADTQTVNEFLTGWLPAVRKTMCERHWKNLEAWTRLHVVPRIGQVRLKDLDPMTFTQMYADITLSPVTVGNIHRFLKRAFNDAPENPVRKAKAPRQRRKKLAVWDANNLYQFLRLVKDMPDSLLWHLLAATGMRRGEALRLDWSDISLDFASVRIVAGKTNRGRLVDLDPYTVATLRPHHQGRGRLFVGREDRFSQRWREAVKSSDLPYMPLKNLRHTHATILLRAGVHPKVVQERLGHSSVAVTLDVYSDYIPSMGRDAAVAFANELLTDTAPRLSEPSSPAPPAGVAEDRLTLEGWRSAIELHPRFDRL